MKIEAGKRHVTRGGWVTPPLVRSTSKDYPWRDQDDWFRWAGDGTEYNGKGSPLCLIAEYVEPTPAEPSRLEIAARFLAGWRANASTQGISSALACADALIAAERETRK